MDQSTENQLEKSSQVLTNKSPLSFDVVHLLLIVVAVLMGIIGYLLGRSSIQLPTSVTLSTPTVTIVPTTIPTPTTSIDEIEAIKAAACKTVPNYKCEARVGKIDGNFAMGTLTTIIDNEVGPGSVWIEAKIDGVWKYIWGGQEVPDCKTMAKYSVPKSLYDTCWQ